LPKESVSNNISFMSSKKPVKWTSSDIPSQVGRRIIITGANSGIGWETALELARAGAHVVLAARTSIKGQDAVDRIRRIVPTAKIQSSILDLASLQSVREFAAREGDQPLDLLINNAGTGGAPQRELTIDGFELQFGTNYLGPFALTALLLPALLGTANPRVIAVASSASKLGKIDFDNLQSERSYRPMWGAYSQAKLADLIFALEFHRRIDTTGTPLMSIACHPGYAITNLGKYTTGVGMKLFTAMLRPWASQDAAHGALPTLYAAVSPDAQPGGHYGPDGPLEAKGYPVAVPIPKQATDITVAKRLWSISENLAGVSFGALSNVP
jgi:NAD(P)-dependent dehydrogenase (short-subunit alcohol dehydrogenase family)